MSCFCSIVSFLELSVFTPGENNDPTTSTLWLLWALWLCKLAKPSVAVGVNWPSWLYGCYQGRPSVAHGKWKEKKASVLTSVYVCECVFVCVFTAWFTAAQWTQIYSGSWYFTIMMWQTTHPFGTWEKKLLGWTQAITDAAFSLTPIPAVHTSAKPLVIFHSFASI